MTGSLHLPSLFLNQLNQIGELLLMSNILVVIGSARTGRVADKVVEYVKADIESREDVTATVVDLAALNLPFYNNEQAAMSPDRVQTDENVSTWSTLVSEADGVVFITPEYNHSLSAIQKNALDWLFFEWNDKPVTAVAYGWTGGSLAVATLREVLTNVKAEIGQDIAQLGFMKDLNPDGSLLDAESVTTQIATAIDAIIVPAGDPIAA
jgi:NAD(P)H-dependent FMN reductase